MRISTQILLSIVTAVFITWAAYAITQPARSASSAEESRPITAQELLHLVCSRAGEPVWVELGKPAQYIVKIDCVRLEVDTTSKLKERRDDHQA